MAMGCPDPNTRMSGDMPLVETVWRILAWLKLRGSGYALSKRPGCATSQMAMPVPDCNPRVIPGLASNLPNQAKTARFLPGGLVCSTLLLFAAAKAPRPPSRAAGLGFAGCRSRGLVQGRGRRLGFAVVGR